MHATRSFGALGGAWLLVSASLALAACDGTTPPPPPPRDAGARDAGGDAAVGAEDAGDPDDGGAHDAGGADAGARDAGPPLAGCTVDAETELMVVGRDTDLARIDAVAAGASATRWAVAFSDDLEGARRVIVVRAPFDGSAPILRAVLDGSPEGARSPSVVALEGGWLLAWEAGGEVVVRRYDAAFAPTAPAHTLAGGGSAPRLAALGAGAYAAWRADGRLYGRALSSTGTPSAPAVDLGALAAGGAFGLGPLGADGGLLVVFGGAEGAAARVRARRISAVGVAGPELAVGTTDESQGSLSSAGPPPTRPDGTAALAGGVAFDVRVGGVFREVRFALLDAEARPAFGEFAVNPSGEEAWGAALTPFRDGFAVAHRTRPRVGGLSQIQLGVMGRESCELGRVDLRAPLAVSGAEAGSPIAMVAQGDAVVLAWSERLVDVVEHRVAVGRCR
ncbi:MAG: hypothetical protein KF729_14310 [Sandaracinaceae bacterium]|nr:hypothetical protein [Sandaracinaceae bacterium]